MDYRALSSIRKHNIVPILRTDETFHRLGRATFVSKMDLKTGYHQLRWCPFDIEKTTFITKYGHFEFSVLPMRLRTATLTFQAPMNSIFKDCIDKFLGVYPDDILTLPDNRENHLKHLRLVLSRSKDNES